jgi:hypothetical protein
LPLLERNVVHFDEAHQRYTLTDLTQEKTSNETSTLLPLKDPIEALEFRRQKQQGLIIILAQVDFASDFSQFKNNSELGRNPCKVRLVLDSSGSGLNDMIERTLFSYPPRYDAEALIYPGCMMGKTDLEAYFNQFPLAPSFSWLTSVQCEDKRLVHLRCPFGLRSLLYFASIMSAFISEGLVRRGIPNSFLLDDFFVTADDLEAIKAVRSKVNQFIRSLGLPVQDAKVEYGHKLAFLGLIYDSLTMTVRVDPRAAASALITIETEIMPHIKCHKRNWSAAPLNHYGKRLESLTGTLNWFCECIQSGRSHLNGFYNLARWGVQLIVMSWLVWSMILIGGYSYSNPGSPKIALKAHIQSSAVRCSPRTQKIMYTAYKSTLRV